MGLLEKKSMINFEGFRKLTVERINEIQSSQSLTKQCFVMSQVPKIEMDNHIYAFDVDNRENNNIRYCIGANPEKVFELLIGDTAVAKQLYTTLNFLKTFSGELSVNTGTMFLTSEYYDYAMIDVSDQSVSFNLMESSTFLNINQYEITLNYKKNNYSLNSSKHESFREASYSLDNESFEKYLTSLIAGISEILPKMLKLMLIRLNMEPETTSSHVLLKKYNESPEITRLNHLKQHKINYLTLEELRNYFNDKTIAKPSNTIENKDFLDASKKYVLYVDLDKDFNFYYDRNLDQKINPLFKKIFTKKEYSALLQIQALANFYSKINKKDCLNLISINKNYQKYNKNEEVYQFVIEEIINITLTLDSKNHYSYNIRLDKLQYGKCESIVEITNIVFEAIIKQIEKDIKKMIGIDIEDINNDHIKIIEMLNI